MLATYNGEKYISEQIDSIIKQTYTNWRLFVRDDSSNDGTPCILNSYEKKDNRIRVIREEGLSGGGSKENFGAIHTWLNGKVPADYYMFCDQDDIWESNKIEICINRIKRLESDYGSNLPILIHTDLKVVDKNLNTIAESYRKYRSINASCDELSRLLIQNVATGCTEFWNAPLNSLINLTSDKIVMHDWWIALAAASFGKIDYVNQATVAYRQHGSNVVGASKVYSLKYLKNRLFNKEHDIGVIKAAYGQAEAFLDSYTDGLSTENQKIVEGFLRTKSGNKITRIYRAIKGRYLRQGFLQILGEMVYI